MAMSRRAVLVRGGVIGAGILSGGVSALEAIAAQNSPPVRRSLEGLAWNDPIVATYRDAVGIMKQKPANDPFNWVQMANIHGNLDTGFRYCPHGDWYFLPWHRGFTVMYERVVRALTGNAEFAMPYWDWTTNPRMPEVFLPKKTPDGKPNWLYVDEEGMRRTWPASQPMPKNIVGASVLKRILRARSFETFGTSRNPQQNSLDPQWVTAGGGVQGTLEATPHNNVHNNIGGWMPSPASPRDPIFFMHHGNIDRIWAVWNQNHKNSSNRLWTGMTFAENFINPDGSYWSPKVSDLLSPEALGYSYGLSPAVATASTETTLALDEQLSSVLAATPSQQGSAGVEVASVANAVAAAPGKPLVLSVSVPEAMVQGAAAPARIPDAAASANDAINGAAPAPTPPRPTGGSSMQALAILRDVAVTDPSQTAVEIYLGDAPVTPQTSTDDPRYVGTFALLDHGEAGHGGHAGHGGRALPSILLDITDPLAAVYGSGAQAPGSITLQVVPVAANAAMGGAGTVTPQRVEIVFVPA